MWTSPESDLDYVLDGGHRISVVLAWLRDDWGDKVLPSYIDEEQERVIRKAAAKVKDRKSTRLNSSHYSRSRMPSCA